MSLITATLWVPRGFAAPFPTKYEFDEAEFNRIAELAKLHLDDAKEDFEESKQDGGVKLDAQHDTEADGDPPSLKADAATRSEHANDDDDLKEYDLEHYDDDEHDGPGRSMGMFGNAKSLAYYESNEDDPYITLKDAQAEEDEEDREDLQILASDNIILTAKVEDELAQLEVYVYEDAADNIYVHHDIMLPAIPLCMEWLDVPVQKKGVDREAIANFVAVGTMDPDIEIWDLDTVDCMYPNAILGQGGKAEGIKEKKKKKKKSKKANDSYHVDAVLSLAANRKHRNLLASASADKTVKLWDLHTTQCAKSYSYHTDKVCSLAWHAVESTVLLSGAYDRTVVAADMRAPDSKVPRWGVESDVETVRWDPHNPNFFFVSTESGIVHYLDARNAPPDPTSTKAVWKLQAHDESVSSFDVNVTVPGFMATGSTDKTVKLWNIQPSGPSIVVSRNFDVGKVFSTTFAPVQDVAFRLAVAGSRGTLHVWDTSTNPAVREAFAQRLATAAAGHGEDRLVGVGDDSSSSGEDGEPEDGQQISDSMNEDED